LFWQFRKYRENYENKRISRKGQKWQILRKSHEISDENNFAPILLYFNKSHFDPILAIYDDSPIIEPKYAPFTWN
jgi:hypothetical protein